MYSGRLNFQRSAMSWSQRSSAPSILYEPTYRENPVHGQQFSHISHQIKIRTFRYQKISIHLKKGVKIVNLAQQR